MCRCLDKIALQSDTIWPSTSAQTDGEDEKNKIIPRPTLVKPYFNYFVKFMEFLYIWCHLDFEFILYDKSNDNDDDMKMMMIMKMMMMMMMNTW